MIRRQRTHSLIRRHGARLPVVAGQPVVSGETVVAGLRPSHNGPTEGLPGAAVAAAHRKPTRRRHARRTPRRSFTLVEVLMVISILAIMAGMVFMAAWGVQEDARAARTKAQVQKLHELIMQRWETYQTRPVPIQIDPNTDPSVAAGMRLNALRELMRMELPDRKTDIIDGSNPIVDMAPPTMWRAYRRRAQATLGPNWQDDEVWSPDFQGAECLYLIVSTMRDGGTSALDFFRPHEIGDLDEDGMPEILDAWGRPIEFLRWAPGYESEVQIRDRVPPPEGTGAADYFDVVKSDPRWQNDERRFDSNFNLYPLIFSPGRDGIYDILTDFDEPLIYRDTTPPNDPYIPSNGMQLGLQADINQDGIFGYEDNITNHALIIQ